MVERLSCTTPPGRLNLTDSLHRRVLNALLLASASLNNIVPSLTDLTKAAAAVQGLYEIIDHCPSIDALSTEGKKVDIVTGCLALKSVSFSYPSRPAVKVLDDVSLEFEAGKTTAIVGPSGSGKLLRRRYLRMILSKLVLSLVPANTDPREEHYSGVAMPLVRPGQWLCIAGWCEHSRHQSSELAQSDRRRTTRTNPLP